MKRTFLIIILCIALISSFCFINLLKEENDNLSERCVFLKEKVDELTNANAILEYEIEELQNLKNGSSDSVEENNENISNPETIQKTVVSNIPDELHLMTYAQTVLEDYFPKCQYSRNKCDYVFVNTGLRYKIEGTVSTDANSTNENFYIIIEFSDEKYESYDLISLQVGNNSIYESVG